MRKPNALLFDIFNGKVTRIYGIPEPDNNVLCLGIYLPHHTDLVVPFQSVGLINGNRVDLEPPISSMTAHGVQK